ncbi:hypothetical protein DFP72DRAFT_572727 [Ephemerocybe angulata]|uniref:Uncharacterized protein n=1 Tax=Ephemerocybe angulata TaxID=980116 RepID=A0A8H6M1T1_9AGAR|nr:hypothetical protein DFP72DRAFT_572727 [Tulosesus angulatus]
MTANAPPTESPGRMRRTAVATRSILAKRPRRPPGLQGVDGNLWMTTKAKGMGWYWTRGRARRPRRYKYKDSCRYIHPTESDLSKPFGDDDHARTLPTSSPLAQAPDDYSGLGTDRGTGRMSVGPGYLVSTRRLPRGTAYSPALKISTTTTNACTSSTVTGKQSNEGRW